MAFYHPVREAGHPAPREAVRLFSLAALAAALLYACRGPSESQGAAFVGTPSLRSLQAVRRGTSALSLSRVQLFAEPEAEKAEAVDAELVDEEEGEDAEEALGISEDEEDDGMSDDEEIEEGQLYPKEAYGEYPAGKTPPESWFDRRQIDRHKVNNIFFDLYRKPKSFFPHKLQPGDTVRVFFMDPEPKEKTGKGKAKDRAWRKISVDSMREVHFDGVILNFRGEYHARTMTLRAMVGKGLNVIGYEMNFPMHSPLVTKIEVLRRGYIGRNKNAYFVRGLIGKKNSIPIDQERTEMDRAYQSLSESGRADEIPEAEYPQQEWDRYPLPMWKQDLDDWDEEQYDPDLVDQRGEYETRILAKYKHRPPGPTGKLTGTGKPR